MAEQPRPYVQRPIDRRVLERGQLWLAPAESPSPSFWICLESEPGRGNSALLNRFVTQARSRKHGLRGCDVVLISAAHVRQRTYQGATLSTLSAALRGVYPTIRRGAFAKRWHKIRNTPSHGILFAAALALPLLVLFVVSTALGEYVPSRINVGGQSSWWSDFFLGYLPRHVMDTPVKALFTLLSSGTFFSLWLLLLRRFQIVSGPGARLDPEEELAFQNVESETSLEPFLALLNPKRPLVLVIDDAYRLTVKDRVVLNSLLSASHRANVAQGRYPRTLVVSVDTAASMRIAVVDGGLSVEKDYSSLPVPKLTPGEIHQIAVANGIDKEPYYDAEFATSAGDNVQRLFRERQRKMFQGVQLELRTALDADGSASFFGLAELMTLWATAGVPAISRGELVAWLRPSNAELFDLLASFNIGAMQEGTNTLRVRLEGTPLVKTDGKTLYFDVIASESIGTALGPDRQYLLLIAHLYWFKHYLRESNALSATASIPQARVEALTKTTAWHATRFLDLTTDDMDREDVYVKAWTAEPVVHILTAAADAWIREGDFKEATDRLREALKWCGIAGSSVPPAEAEAFADTLWSLYWSTASSFARSALDRLAELFPAIRRTSAWSRNQAHWQVLTGGDTGETDDPGPVTTDIQAWTRVLREVRSTHLFLGESLPLMSIAPPTARPADAPSEWTLKVRAAALVSAHRRGDWPAFDAAFPIMIDELESYGRSAQMPDRARHWFWRSVAWHLIATSFESGPAERRDVIRGYASRLIALDSRQTTPLNDYFGTFAFQAAVRCLKNSIRFSTLLGQHVLGLDGSMHMLWIARNAANRPEVLNLYDWPAWNELFKIARDQLDAVGWQEYEAEYHLARWTVLNEFSVSDALADLDYIARRALAVDCSIQCRVRWVGLAGTLFTNHHRTPADVARAGELMELWARDFAGVAHALGMARLQADPLLDKAYALKFAFRFAHQRGASERAEAMSLEALQLTEEAGRTGAPEEAVREVRRDVIGERIGLSASLYSTDDAALISELWAGAKPVHYDSWSLMSRLRLDSQRDLLKEEWPRPGFSWREDPENASLSLPVGWPLAAADVRTRLAFRLAQLFLFYDAEPTVEAIDKRIAPGATMNDAFLFEALAGHAWVIDVGPTLKALVIPLVRIGLSVAERDHDLKHEIRMLEMLVYHDRFTWLPRLLFEKRKLAALLRSEIEVQHVEDIYPAIVQINGVFDSFVQSDLELEGISAEARRRGVAVSALRSEKRALAVHLAAVERRLRQGETGLHKELVDRLPDPAARWLTVEDVWALHLMMQVAPRLAGNATVEGIEDYASRLTEVSRRYMQQTLGTISHDPEIEKLAVEMMELLETRMVV